MLTVLALTALTVLQIGTLRDVALAWDANPIADQVIGYTVYVGEQCGSFTRIRDLGAPVTTDVVTGLDAAKAWCFAVDAYNAAGEHSALSATVTLPAVTEQATTEIKWDASKGLVLTWDQDADLAGVATFRAWYFPVVNGIVSTTSTFQESINASTVTVVTAWSSTTGIGTYSGTFKAKPPRGIYEVRVSAHDATGLQIDASPPVTATDGNLLRVNVGLKIIRAKGQ